MLGLIAPEPINPGRVVSQGVTAGAKSMEDMGSPEKL